MTPKTIKVTIKIEYITKPGEVLWISIREEGEEEKWIEMKWTNGHN